MRKPKQLNKIYWIYGGAMGVLMILLEVIHYKAIIRDLEIELYGAITGIIFLALGIWLGTRMIKQNPVSEKYDPEKLNLSKRELEVLELLTAGFSNQEIADKLFVSLNTTKTHISNIYVKLNVKRRTQAIQKARNLALTTTSEG